MSLSFTQKAGKVATLVLTRAWPVCLAVSLFVIPLVVPYVTFSVCYGRRLIRPRLRVYA